jgi:methylmalonyl-CoA/ethylmalonyl-CoA epimerase
VITRIHHVAVAVRDLDAALGFWLDALGLPLVRAADVPEQRVRAALLACGPAEVELITPTAPGTGVARFLASRGEALHHVCFESDQIDRDLRRFRGTGVDLIDAKARPGLAGMVAFVHPRASAGLLVEVATPLAPAALPEAPLALAAVHAKVEDVPAAAQRYVDLFGVTPGLRAGDGSLAHLSIGGLTLQFTPLGDGTARPALTALRLRTGDLAAFRARLEARGIEFQSGPAGVVIGPGPAGGAPLIVEPRP